MSEIQMSSTTWNALIGIINPPQNDAVTEIVGKESKQRLQRRCNTNLQLLKVHFKYQPWHKIRDNEKLNMSEDDPLRMVMALYRNQEYLYRQMRALEDTVREIWGLSME